MVALHYWHSSHQNTRRQPAGKVFMARRRDEYDDSDDYYYDDDDDDDDEFIGRHDEDDDEESGYDDDDFDENHDGYEQEEEDDGYPVKQPKRVPGRLEISEELRRLLAEWRAVDGSRKAPRFNAQLVKDVDDAIESRVPDPVVALWTCPFDDLLEYEIDAARLVDNAADAHTRGVPHDYIAFGRHPDDHAFYCYNSRIEPLGGSLYVTEFDNLDGSSTSVMKLEEWLANLLESRREFLAEGDAAQQKRADAQPTPAQYKKFHPELID